MMSRAESHLRIDNDIISCLGYIFMEGTMDNTSVIDHNRLKEIFFPFFVPVFVFRFNVCISDLRIGQRKFGYCIFYCIFIA